MEDKTQNRPKIIKEFIDSLGEDFEAKLWLLVKIRQNPDTELDELLGVSCTSIMKKGYSFSELRVLAQKLKKSGHIEISLEDQCKINPETNFNLTNLFTYATEKFETKVSAIDQMVDCGFEYDGLESLLEGYDDSGTTKRIDLLINAGINNAIPLAIFVTKLLSGA